MSSCVQETKAKWRDKIAKCIATPQTLRRRYLFPVAFGTRDKMVPIIYLLLIVPLVTSTEHSGAYSSPQYAKKMFPKNYDSSAFLPKEKQSTQFNRENNIDRYDDYSNDTSSYGRSSLLESAGSFLSGAGGQVVSSLAKDFIARSTGSSQVGFDCMSQVRIALNPSLHASFESLWR